ncbi:sugar phosphate isomerase/epimerase family protein [Kosmotoga pacifica]|uniref:Xylose isomerase n=1 Tax=Kosmotoga pacifica TaxID=1330330 RepID=A0A0G2Z771_9BACT|nr:sugar phosphate isomerase/epimerase [Kosmotoga pacifica]AKI97412.1 xylose isomerase [Kosmotoga pacifica]
MIKGFGVNIDTGRVNGSLKRFREELNFFKGIGFDYIELPPAGLDVIYHRKLRVQQAERIKNILSEFPFGLTVHCPDPVNLKQEGANYERGFEVLRTTIEFAAHIGAEVVVYHLGSFGHNQALNLQEQYLKEINALRELGELAGKAGIKIAVENTLQPVSEVIKVLDEVKHESVSLLMDIGHLYLYCKRTGKNFLEEVDIGLARAVELHVHDNFGEGEFGYSSEIITREPFRFTYGIGDLHLPLGQGSIPYPEIFKLIKAKGFSGIVTLEINSKDRFEEDYLESFKIMRGIYHEEEVK